MRALVVDDSRTVRRILGKILTEVGFKEIEDAGNGQEALDILGQRSDFDIALVDWNMPVMAGIDFVKSLRAKPEFDHVRVMMVTTESQITDITSALEAGADEYVVKPFTSDVIRDKLGLLGIG